MSTQTELSFLLELLLEHKLPKDTRSAVASRIKFVEHTMVVLQPGSPAPRPVRTSPIPANAEAHALAASLASEANADIAPSQTRLSERVARPEPIPAKAVGVTSAAAEAMATRNKLIAEAQAGIAKKGPAVGRGHGTK